MARKLNYPGIMISIETDVWGNTRYDFFIGMGSPAQGKTFKRRMINPIDGASRIHELLFYTNPRLIRLLEKYGLDKEKRLNVGDIIFIKQTDSTYRISYFPFDLLKSNHPELVRELKGKGFASELEKRVIKEFQQRVGKFILHSKSDKAGRINQLRNRGIKLTLINDSGAIQQGYRISSQRMIDLLNAKKKDWRKKNRKKPGILRRILFKK